MSTEEEAGRVRDGSSPVRSPFLKTSSSETHKFEPYPCDAEPYPCDAAPTPGQGILLVAEKKPCCVHCLSELFVNALCYVVIILTVIH